MRVAQVPKPGAPFELVDRPIPEPGPREVRIKVEACGICHSDSFPLAKAQDGYDRMMSGKARFRVVLVP
jgi:D-arabinose 1-dehydrogenase-like Zn-dependent alcohol dehydrogenase